MNITRVSATIAVSACLLSTTVVGQQPQQQRSSLRFDVTTAEYFDLVYGPRNPDAPYVFFPGEPIKTLITIYNESQTFDTPTMPRGQTDAAVRVIATRDGRPADITVSVESRLQLQRNDLMDEIGWAGIRAIGPEDRLVIPAQIIQDEKLLPGVYTVETMLGLTDEKSRVIVPHYTRFQFELRVPNTLDDRLEMTRRAATRALVAGNLEAAFTLTETVLQLYPNSFAAYYIRGEVAAARSNPNEAALNYERAAAVLRDGVDLLYLKQWNQETARGAQANMQKLAQQQRAKTRL
jgi:hypothetical protein